MVKGDKEVQLKTRVELTCSVSSVPPAKIIWKLNGTVIPGETKDTLIYNNIEYKHSGTYTCEASNEVTRKSTNSPPLSVTVKGKIVLSVNCYISVTSGVPGAEHNCKINQ